jgi:hypothetical protein
MIALFEILDFLLNLGRAIRWLCSKQYRNSLRLNPAAKYDIYWGLLMLAVIIIVALAMIFEA